MNPALEPSPSFRPYPRPFIGEGDASCSALIGWGAAGRTAQKQLLRRSSQSVSAGQTRSPATVCRCRELLSLSPPPHHSHPLSLLQPFQMSLSDFWVHRLISTTTPSPVPSCSSASSDDISKVSSSDHPPLLKPEALKPTDYNAFQMLQMQLMWQPQLMQNFLAMIHLEQEQRQREQQQRFKVSVI